MIKIKKDKEKLTKEKMTIIVLWLGVSEIYISGDKKNLMYQHGGEGDFDHFSK